MAGPSPRVAAVRSAVAALDLPPGAHVVVACSGGPDSLALAAAVAHVAPRRGWLARAVVVDHSLHAGSAAAAAAAAAACRALGLQAEVRAVQVPGGGRGTGAGGPEAAARDVRHRALDDAARDFAPDAVVLLGHTMDDQAETVLLGLGRGSGARSLAGMAAATGRLRRPFLHLRRADTLGACADLGLTPLVDPTNEPDGTWRRADGGPLRRSALRHAALPALEEALGPGVVPALARTADQLRRDADLLDALARDVLAEVTRAGDGTSLSLDAAGLEAAHPAMRSRVVREAIMGLADRGVRGALAARHIAAVEALISDYHGQGTVHLPVRLTARRRGATLVIAKE